MQYITLEPSHARIGMDKKVSHDLCRAVPAYIRESAWHRLANLASFCEWNENQLAYIFAHV